jgi:hypothetical protein
MITVEKVKLEFVCPQCKETQTINTNTKDWKMWRGVYLCDCMADLYLDINFDARVVTPRFR